MDEVLLKNHKCAKNVLDNYFYDIDEDDLNNIAPVLKAHKYRRIEDFEKKLLKIAVKCTPPYDKFELLKQDSKIEYEEAEEELERLNGELSKCIKQQNNQDR